MIRRLTGVSLLVAVLLSLTPVGPATSGSSRQSQLSSENADQRTWLVGLQSYAALGNWMLDKLTRGLKRGREITAAPPATAFLNPAPFFIDAPTNLTVTGAADGQIVLSWTAPAGSVTQYQVERANVYTSFGSLNTASGTTFIDSTASTDHAYLYRVRAVATGGAVSLPSNTAFGTATSFEFTSLLGQDIKAQHFYDVRTAINAVRALAALPAATWTRGTLAGLGIEANDVQEMRDKLKDALDVLNISVAPYADPTLSTGNNGTPIRAIHLEQLQTRSTRGSSNDSGPLNSDLSTARLDPVNQTGGGGENPLSRNYNWSVPLVNLPGRAGLDLGLSLSYNSLVWTKTGSFITFNDDAGFPSPGFRLGFPVIQGPFVNTQANKNTHLLITPDGKRIELRQVGSSTSTIYESVDSSHLLLDTTTMVLRTIDGTQFSYIYYGGEFKCTQVKDRNGNFITVTYLSDGRINTILDTLGRTLTFVYNAPPDNTLNSITQTWAGQTDPYVWASFTYVDTEVQTGFLTGITKIGPANGLMVKTLRRVTLNDNASYEFDHTKWIQVSKIKRLAPDGHLLNYSLYDLPADGSTQRDDCPRFTERRDWAENFNRGGSPGTTGLPSGSEEEVVAGAWTGPTPASWTLPDGTNESGMVAQVTLPDGTYSKFYFAATGWKRGLPSMVETYGKTTPDQSTAIKQKTRVTTWTQDDENVAYLLHPRLKETHVYDFDGLGVIKNHSRTRTTYVLVDFGDGTSCYLPQDVFEYQANATTVLRRTRTDYLTPAGAYITARVVGLVSEHKMYEVNPTTAAETLMTRVAYAYDEPGSILTADAAIQLQHDHTNYGSGFVAGRGNVSSVTRYNVVSGSTVTTAMYNTAGSLRKTIDALLHEVNIGYADSFSDGTNRNSFAYATSLTNADGFVTTSQYNFNFGSITRSQTPPPADQTTGPIKKYTYDAKNRLEKITLEITGNTDYSHTRFVYPDSKNRVDIYTTVQAGQGEAQAFTLFDGNGRAFATASAHPGSTGGYSAKLMLFDKLGRTIKESNPTETDVVDSYFNWAATGDDNTQNGGSGWVYTSRVYDWNNRSLSTTNPAGKSKTASYNGCGCAGGEVVTLTDEVGRRRKIYTDVLGRQTKTEVLNTDNSVYSAAVNTYNARDQVTLVRQWAGPENGGGVFQDTTQSYDGYGRLQSRHLPQQNAGAATTWTYNADDTIHSMTDARGASATYTYNNGRRLVTKIEYSAPTGVTATATAEFAYDAAGNRTSMDDGMGSQTYTYNQLSRITSEVRTFNGVSGSFTLSYGYNLAGALTSITDSTNSTINYSFDAIGRLSQITGSDTLYGGVSTYASSFSYRASGSIKGLTYGNNYTLSATYDSVLRPTRFQVTRPTGADVIKNDYSYYDDGSPKFMHDAVDDRFDRSYGYDHRTMLKEAFSGSEARDFVNNTTTSGWTGPYHQVYQYDAFGNMTQRDSRFWSETDVFTASYSNHRRTETGYTYDADGNLIQDPDVSYGFDAAGNNTSLTSQGVTHTTSFDGDGQMVKKVQTSSGTTISTIIYLRSSVLGGRVVTELNAQGQKQVGYVFAGSEVLARQVNNIVSWEHRDPLTGSRVDSRADGNFDRISQLDPMGVDVGFADPFLFCCDAPPIQPEQRTFYLLDGSGVPDGRCTLDGIAIDCGWAFQLIDNGAAVQCPNNDCGPRVMDTFDRNGNFLGRVLSQPFQAFADGFSGFLPPGARYEGQGTWVIPGARSSEPPSLKHHAPRPGAGAGNRDPDNVGDDEGEGSSDIFGNIGQTPQNQGTNPFPTFDKDKTDVIDKALKEADEMTDPQKHKECDQALQAFGIPSLNALLSKMNTNSNIFDGRTSTLVAPIGKNGANQSVGDYFKEQKANVGAIVLPQSMTGRGEITFLGNYFFSPVSVSNLWQQRAIILIHEAVHVAGKGDAVFGGSKALSEKIIEKCEPVLKGKLGGVG